jgi:cytoskeletal protein CcmA (bactofilin family)
MEFNEFRNLKFTVLGHNCKFQGQMILSGPVTIASTIEGDIHMEDDSLITIERDAKYSGKIKAHDIEIFGEFEGDLEAKGKLVIRSSAVVKGNIKAQNMAIYPGCYLDMEAHTEDS